MRLPMRHLSIRVPWHDAGWAGCICRNPKGNAACLALDRIRETRRDDQEEADAGACIADLPPSHWPACMVERGTFMAPFEFIRSARQPYSETSDLHNHMLPTDVRHPAYSAAAIPFRWMRRESAWDLAEQHGVPADASREPRDPDWLRNNAWVQNHQNQEALLEAFFSAVERGKSLCFFYAKQTPLAEDDRRVIVGVGRVKHVGRLLEYDYSTTGGIRAYIWDRAIQHTIRPDFKDGFILPYQQIVQLAAADPSVDPAEFVAFAPDDRRLEFSYAAEHVTHDGAIAALLACKATIDKAQGLVEGEWGRALKWIDLRLADLWKLRGPYPGLGAALTAFGVEHGSFLAYELAESLGENDDPWPLVDQVFRDPSLLPKALAGQVTTTLRKQWEGISVRNPDRLALLKLLARFEITPEQATRFWVQEKRRAEGIDCTDRDILANPYLVYEHDRVSPESVSVWTVDRGLFPVPAVRDKHPLPEPSALEGATDARRVRALTVAMLESAASEGHTLLPGERLVMAIRETTIEPACPASGDMLDAIADLLAPAVSRCDMHDGSPAYQLGRLADVGALIRSTVEKRIRGKRHVLAVDWAKRLDAILGECDLADQDEARARIEKASALKVLAESRLSVLIGPAGTGKTTLLSVLCQEPSIAAGDVLLLAPTGKARVQLQQATKIPAQTLAQFLLPHRYDERTGTYHVSAQDKMAPGKTVIVDEASMLTEEQLGALLDALKAVDRLILVGDPRQLPPIGAGRPFVDIVARLAPENAEALFPRVGDGYAELTVRRRQAGQDREDLQLAEWFSGRPLGPGDDEILTRIMTEEKVGHVRFVPWADVDELQRLLLRVLADELPDMQDENDALGFEVSLGGTRAGDLVYFNMGAACRADAWQILTPVRGMPYGVRDINRLIQTTFRARTVEFAKGRACQIPSPMGPEGVVYGDKVMNVENRRRSKVHPERKAESGREAAALKYVANGEIGIAVGQFRARSAKWYKPWLLKVEFSSQLGFGYDYEKRDFKEEGSALLELAYAITVHKAQGSEFGLCLLVLPSPCRLLSQELLYTALTRQRDRIVILHQGERGDLRRYASAYHSETARRMTNLFAPPKPLMVSDRFLEENLIHRSGRGEPMRSKSEVIIADRLAEAGVEYVYEQPLVGTDGQTRFPDFTIEDADTGETYYWEHCGMLDNRQYRERWERKLTWYREQQILPREEGGGPRGILIETRDSPGGGIDSRQIRSLIQDLWG